MLSGGSSDYTITDKIKTMSLRARQSKALSSGACSRAT